MMHTQKFNKSFMSKTINCKKIRSNPWMNNSSEEMLTLYYRGGGGGGGGGGWGVGGGGAKRATCKGRSCNRATAFSLSHIWFFIIQQRPFTTTPTQLYPMPAHSPLYGTFCTDTHLISGAQILSFICSASFLLYIFVVVKIGYYTQKWIFTFQI
jgi:hypothetical protein